MDVGSSCTFLTVIFFRMLRRWVTHTRTDTPTHRVQGWSGYCQRAHIYDSLGDHHLCDFSFVRRWFEEGYHIWYASLPLNIRNRHNFWPWRWLQSVTYEIVYTGWSVFKDLWKKAFEVVHLCCVLITGFIYNTVKYNTNSTRKTVLCLTVLYINPVINTG